MLVNLAKLGRRVTVLASLAMSSLASAAPGPDQTAELILANATVSTSGEAPAARRSVAIRAGKILFVGRDADVRRLRGASTKVVDLGGKLLLPGFIDTHNHVYLRGEELFYVKLPGGPRPIGPADAGRASMDSYRDAIAAYRAKNPGLRQVRGVGLDLAMVLRESAARGKQPRQLLDELVPDLPAVVIAHSHHELWANSKAIALAGIGRDTPTPHGGVIGRDPKTNEPNGIFNEMSAQNLVVLKLPEPDLSVAQQRQAILSWQKLAAERGVTGVIVPTHYPTINFFVAMQQLSDEGALTARYNVAQWVDEARGISQVPDLVATRARFPGGPLFKLNTAKIFATAVPDSGLEMIWSQDDLNRTMAALDKAGLRLFIHDIGSTASYEKVVDAFTYVVQQNGRRDSRHILSHLFSPSAPVAVRFNAIGLRGDGHPAPKSYYDNGVPTTSSSDYPVWDFQPLPRVQAAVKEGVPLSTMIQSQTLRGAEALFAEGETGTIQAGKSADLILLDQNIFQLPADRIAQAKVIRTWFRGATVFAAPAAGDGATDR